MESLIPNEQALVQLWVQLTDLAVQYGLSLLGAILLLIAGWVVASWAKRAVLRAMNRTTHIDVTLKPFIANIVRYTILILVLVAVLAQFGVQTASIIAMLGAAGLAIGLALQGTLQNIAAGMMLLFLRPFRSGDYIDAGGISGTVDEIGLFVTEMRTADGVYISVPNQSLWNSTIKNYTRLHTRRLDVTVGIAYSDDIGKAQCALMEMIAADQRVLDDPAPEVMVIALADSSVNINIRCWTRTENYWALLVDTNKAVKETLDAAGISIPFPQRDIRIVSSAAPSGGNADNGGVKTD